MIDDKLKHIAIIIDGNGRWAQKRGMKRSQGHKAGFETLQDIATYANKIGVKYLSVYAFSVDNFKRSEEEVNYLMNLFIKKFTKEYNKFLKDNIKIVFSGSKEGKLPEDVKKAMIEIEEKTKDKTGGIFNICLNYGGQEEIIRAAERYHDDLASGKVQKGEVSRDDFFRYLDQNIPPIDILIRTGGEKRLSNFMLYQLNYAEIYFVDTYWPDFTTSMLDDIIDDFYGRDRRFGGINEKKSNSWFYYCYFTNCYW